MSKEFQDHDGKPTETTDLILWELRTLKRQLDSLHWTDLGVLHLGESSAALSVCEPLAVGLGSVPGAWAGTLEPILHGGMPWPAVLQWGETWSCLNLICPALLTPMGGLTLLNEDCEEVDSGWCKRKMWKKWEERRKGNWLVCKILIKTTVIATKQGELKVW